MHPDARTGPREVNTEDPITLVLTRNLATMANAAEYDSMHATSSPRHPV